MGDTDHGTGIDLTATTEPVLYPEMIAAYRASVDALPPPSDPGTIGGHALHHAITRLVERLDAETVALSAAIGARVAAVEAESAVRLTLDYADLHVRAGCYEAGVEGKTAAEREINLALAVTHDRDLIRLRQRAELARTARLAADGRERQADIAHKATRAQLAALAALTIGER